MKEALELLVAGTSLLAGLVILKAGEARRLATSPVVYDLRFPASLTSQDVERLLASLTALLPPWWKRIIAQPVVGFELYAEPGKISHRVIVPTSHCAFIEGAFQAHLPGVRYQRMAQSVAWQPLRAAEYRTTSDARPLRADAEAVAASLLSSVQPVGKNELVVIQWLLTAAWPVRPPRARRPGERPYSWRAELFDTTEEVTARRNKLRAPLLLV